VVAITATVVVIAGAIADVAHGRTFGAVLESVAAWVTCRNLQCHWC